MSAEYVTVNGRDYRLPRRPTVVFTVDGGDPAYFEDALTRGLMPNLRSLLAGPGSLHHLLGEWMNIEAGMQMLHVPFKGAAPAFTDLLGGRIDVLIETATFSIPHVKAGRLRALALSSAGRYPLLPEVPAVGETLKGVEFSSWLGVAVAPGTPRATIDRLNRELGTILSEDDVRERFAGFGGVPAHSSPEQMRARIEREIERWRRVVETRGIQRQ